MAKRPHERKTSEPNGTGRGKWQKTASGSRTASGSVTQQNQWKPLPGSVTFRVLCHSSKFGSIIGKGGGIVASIRQETGARIKIEEIVQGCEDRVVVITGSEKEVEVSKVPNKEDSKEASAVADGDINEENKGSNDNDEEKVESSALEASKSEKPLSPVQNALLLVYGRLVEGEKEDDTVDDEGRKFAPFSVRLLIYPSQVGRLLGKGGSVIKQMSSDSGGQIRVLPKDQIPLCASPMDEVVQISGDIDSVKRALQSVSKLLLDNPPRERALIPTANPSGPLSQPFASFPRAEVLPPPNFFPPAHGPAFPRRPFDTVDYRSNVPPSFPKFHEGAASGPIQVSPSSITYRLLCSNDKVGSVIGKGGSRIKAIQQETGCEIKVHETAEPEDRIVLISGTAFPGDRISPAQDALLRVHERIVMSDNKESMVSTRLVVSSAQIGCLLGKGGSIITDMRKLTGAQIRILGKDTPRSVAENDELVQVSGEFRTVQDALVQITTRLRDHLFRDINVPSMNHTTHPFDQMPPFGPYVGRIEPSPTRMYPNLPPQFQNDSTGRPHEERPFPHTPGAHLERMPPGPWAPQGMREGGGTMPMPDFSGAASQRRIGGFPGGNQPTITVDVVVPRALVPSIYGEDGFCLKRIREISEAKITITEPRPEATETVILISGIPEQTHAAQSLLQAFVLSESAPV